MEESADEALLCCMYLCTPYSTVLYLHNTMIHLSLEFRRMDMLTHKQRDRVVLLTLESLVTWLEFFFSRIPKVFTFLSPKRLNSLPAFIYGNHDILSGAAASAGMRLIGRWSHPAVCTVPVHRPILLSASLLR
jgi:hypothetical protein